MTIRATLLACVLLTGAGAVQWASRPEVTPPRLSFSAFPNEIGGWHATLDSPLDPGVLAILRVDDYLNRVYAAPGGTSLSFYVGYFRSQRVGQTIHSPMVCLPGGGWQPQKTEQLGIPVTFGAPLAPAVAATGPKRLSPTIEVNRLVIENGSQQRELVLYWYQSGERVVSGDYLAKMYKFLDAMRYNRTDGALVRVMVPISPDSGGERGAEQQAVEFVKETFPLLAGYLPR